MSLLIPITSDVLAHICKNQTQNSTWNVLNVRDLRLVKDKLFVKAEVSINKFEENIALDQNSLEAK